MESQSLLRVVVAFDKFKYALSARKACAVAVAAVEAVPGAVVTGNAPLTDGGEGFAEILTHAVGGTLRRVAVTGPLGAPVEACYGIVAAAAVPVPTRELAGLPGTGRIGIVEMAQAAGIELLPDELRDPWRATTFGVGELLARLAEEGVDAIVLGIGGSATNDAGSGCLGALGMRFHGADGTLIAQPCPIEIENLERLDPSGLRKLPPLRVACDVTNPLLGERGATRIYGPQKGLRPVDTEALEAAVDRFSLRLLAALGGSSAIRETPGAGAAGGIGFGLMAAYGAKLVPGFRLIESWLGLERILGTADWVLTGEGRFDRSSLSGKGPHAVAIRAVEQGARVAVLAGAVEEEAARSLREATNGRADAIAITPEGVPLAEALETTGYHLGRKVAEILKA